MPVQHSDVVVTCEHASARVPAAYAQLFASAEARHALTTHRGLDIGAEAMARVIARHWGVTLHRGTATRLLVELNRSLHHPDLFSPYVDGLNAEERAQVLKRYYTPYREAVERELVRKVAARGAKRGGKRVASVFHLSVHSFTPVFKGVERNADVGLLYDPSRVNERRVCAALAVPLRVMGLRVRFNYPYRGTSDGFTTYLRRKFVDAQYAGIEIEVNQALLPNSARAVAFARRVLLPALADAVRIG